MKLIITLLFLLILPSAFAVQGSMTLLAATQVDDKIIGGSPATLYLEIQEGQGRVFMETYPLTKIDTQVSARFAKELACDFLDKDCNNYDFFYKIKSESSIIGGPSAGAAITILTIALLNDLEVNESMSITGTINSGDIIGPVGGITAKLEAAKKANLTKILIPKQYDENESINISLKAKELNITVQEVFYLNDALYEFTGYKQDYHSNTLIIDSQYTSVMKGLADDLCKRTDSLIPQMELTENSTIYENLSAVNLTVESKTLYEKGNYYSAASRCYGANTKYRLIELIETNYSNAVMNVEIKKVRNKIEELEDDLEKRQLNTITDLQTYVIVKERLIEARINLDDFVEYNYSFVYFANAQERVESARTWGKFFNIQGKEFDITKESLKDSCAIKLREAEERFQYINLLLPGMFQNAKESLDTTYALAEEEEYALCLFKASKVKAQINVVLSTLGFSEEDLASLVDLKLEAAKHVINSQIEDDLFPIVGYSYYEYSGNLKDIDNSAALLYAEYALELSRLDLYFKEKTEPSFSFSSNDKKMMIILAIGLASGFVIGFFFRKRK